MLVIFKEHLPWGECADLIGNVYRLSISNIGFEIRVNRSQRPSIMQPVAWLVVTASVCVFASGKTV
jgi:hypothetical protein